MGHNFKKKSHLNNWVHLESLVTLGKMGHTWKMGDHTWKNGSYLRERDKLGEMVRTCKKAVTLEKRGEKNGSYLENGSHL